MMSFHSAALHIIFVFVGKLSCLSFTPIFILGRKTSIRMHLAYFDIKFIVDTPVYNLIILYSIMVKYIGAY